MEHNYMIKIHILVRISHQIKGHIYMISTSGAVRYSKSKETLLSFSVTRNESCGIKVCK